MCIQVTFKVSAIETKEFVRINMFKYINVYHVSSMLYTTEIHILVEFENKLKKYFKLSAKTGVFLQKLPLKEKYWHLGQFVCNFS